MGDAGVLPKPPESPQSFLEVRRVLRESPEK